MVTTYSESQDALDAREIRSRHESPHLHKSIEIVYVTEGTLELGVGMNLFHMEEGDLGIIFPNLIHHFQVFDTAECRAVHILAASLYLGPFTYLLNSTQPKDPVIRRKDLAPLVINTLLSLVAAFPKRHHRTLKGARELSLEQAPAGNEQITRQDLKTKSRLVELQAMLQLVLSRTLYLLTLEDRQDAAKYDIVYQVVNYIAQHFRENLTLTGMAKDLGVSPYALSRVFSSTFHRNFNRYLNEVRLDYACALLARTDEPVTEVCLDAGFQSQQTFNRVFQEHYHMSPRQYRHLSELAGEE